MKYRTVGMFEQTSKFVIRCSSVPLFNSLFICSSVRNLSELDKRLFHQILSVAYPKDVLTRCKASRFGNGKLDRTLSIGEIFPVEQSSIHINYLDLKVAFHWAIDLCIQCACEWIRQPVDGERNKFYGYNDCLAITETSIDVHQLQPVIISAIHR